LGVAKCGSGYPESAVAFLLRRAKAAIPKASTTTAPKVGGTAQAAEESGGALVELD
jgi:hypothetical protein